MALIDLAANNNRVHFVLALIVTIRVDFFKAVPTTGDVSHTNGLFTWALALELEAACHRPHSKAIMSHQMLVGGY